MFGIAVITGIIHLTFLGNKKAETTYEELSKRCSKTLDNLDSTGTNDLEMEIIKIKELWLHRGTDWTTVQSNNAIIILQMISNIFLRKETL